LHRIQSLAQRVLHTLALDDRGAGAWRPSIGRHAAPAFVETSGGGRAGALRLNRRAKWASDESIASVLPSLSALDEIAALDAAYAAGVARAERPADAVHALQLEACLRDLAAWATGVRTACELATELRDD